MSFLLFLFLFLLLIFLPMLLNFLLSTIFSIKLNSREECSVEISKALNSQKYRVIGLYGNMGSGKSALVKSKLREYRKNFGRVFYFDFHSIVSENQDIKTIQEGIAKKLDVHFERDDNRAQRALKINSKLVSMGGSGTTLVILDGFPTTCKPRELLGLSHPRKGCKVLLTARNKVDCASMGCGCSIRMKPLYQDEALNLLLKLAGFPKRSPLFGVAVRISSKCNGSPGLISDVVTSLKDKSIEKWKETSVSLSNSADYQIFLNFRGKDTRESFIKPLYQSLCSKGFKTFMDDESLERGAPIDNLLRCIDKSRSAIVVLSKNYTDSEWPLRELVKILKCRKWKNQLVLPIFYEVEPTVIKNLSGRFGEAMVKHEKKFGKDSNTIKEWKQALKEITQLKGEHYESTDDQLIGKIVNNVWDQRHRLHIQSMY